MKIKFLDGSVKEFENGMSAGKIAMAISPSLAKKSVVAKVNGVLVDLDKPINEDSELELVLKESSEAYAVLNHSCSHLLASAIHKLYPKAMFGVGPNIEEGFYYDINPGEGITITEADFSKIEKEMQRLVAADLKFERKEVSKEEALKMFANDKYKTELINELPEGEIISVYTDGDYSDFCRGPHVPSTKWCILAWR